MKQITLVLAFLIFSPNATTNNDIQLTAYWKKGDTQKIVIKEGFIDYKNDEIVKKEVSSSYATITILEETDSSYTTEWHYTHMEWDRVNVEVEEDEFDKRFDEMFAQAKLIIQTDEFGAFQQILNLDETIQMVNDSMDLLIKEEMGDMGEDAEMFSMIIKELLYSDQMKNELERDAWTYHYYLGGVYAADTLAHYDDQWENKISGEKIPVKGTISIKTDYDKKVIMINDSKQIDENETKEAMNDVAEQLDKKQAKKLKRKMKSKSLNIQEIENFSYDYENGWLKYYEKNKIYTTEGERKEKFLIIEEIE